MDVFPLRDHLVQDYRHYVESFVSIRDERIAKAISDELEEGLLWPDPRLQLNPTFASGGFVEELVADGILHPECRIFSHGNEPGPSSVGVRRSGVGDKALPIGLPYQGTRQRLAFVACAHAFVTDYVLARRRAAPE